MYRSHRLFRVIFHFRSTNYHDHLLNIFLSSEFHFSASSPWIGCISVIHQIPYCISLFVNTFCVYSCCQFHSREFSNKLITSQFAPRSLKTVVLHRTQLMTFYAIHKSRVLAIIYLNFYCSRCSIFPLQLLPEYSRSLLVCFFCFISIWQITKVFPFRLQSREGWCWCWWQRHGMRLRGAEFKCPGIVTDGERSRERYTRWEECWLDSILYTLRSALELDFHLGMEMCFSDGNERTKQIEWKEM